MKSKIFTTILLSCFIVFVSAQIIHVPEDYSSIQAGINAASNGDTVLVADSVYFENINFKGKAITVASNFIMDGDTSHISNTIINGSQPFDPDSAYVVAFISSEDTTSILSGFTITGGSGLFDAMTPARIGGGIVCLNSGAKIVHNIIIDNEADYQYGALGAGIGCLIYMESHSIVIENNIIADNYNHVLDNGAFGGGIYIGSVSESSIEVTARVCNNIIENNYCYGELNRADGGGIKIQGSAASTTIIDFYNNTVQNNSIRSIWTRGAGFCGLEAQAFIINNDFLNNYIDSNSTNFRGAAICFKLPIGKVNIVNNRFLNNVSPLICESGTGAVNVMDGYENQVIVDGNIFTNNTGEDGGGFYSRRSYNLSVSNNIFVGNSAFIGGAITLNHPSTALLAPLAITTSGSPLIINNTFVDNTSISGGNTIRFSGIINPPVIINSIFWQTSGPVAFDILNESPLNIHVYYSNIEPNSITGPWEGVGNIFEDPLFVDELFHLNNCESLCVNAGIDALEIDSIWYFCPTNDIDNEIRPFENTYPDMGADETPCLENSIIKYQDQPNSNISLSIYPNPVVDKTTIEVFNMESEYVMLSLVDFTGKEIQLIISQQLSEGSHQFKWNSEGLPAGIYFCVLKTNDGIQTRKIVKL